MPVDQAARRRGILLVLVATVLWSLAGVYTRMLNHLDLWTILCGRALFGGLCISAWGIVEYRRGALGPRFGLGPLAPLIIILSATAITSYIAAVKTTTVADVLVIYATMPFVTAALAYLITGERASRRTIIAAGIALCGVVIMVAGGIGAGGRLLGQALAMLMTLTFGLMVVLQRRSPAMSMTSVNAGGAFVSSAFAFHFSPLPPLGDYDIVILFLFGLTTICLAFVMFMEGAKHIPAAEAGLISLLDVVIGPLWVFLGFRENPGPSAVIGGVIVLAAVLWRVAPELARAAPPVDAKA
jgi:drug/metabolite transporter (DMT)-like permease